MIQYESLSKLITISSLVNALDKNISNHLSRVQMYVNSLALKLRNNSRFKEYLIDQNIIMLLKSVPFHDVGKIGIPDYILFKPGRLEPEELAIMKLHTTIGCKIIMRLKRYFCSDVDFLNTAQKIALSHHEKWDGTGYPQGLAGENIPTSARLMAVADVYDALISPRVYRKEMSHEKVVQVIVEGRGTHFDPDVVNAFVNSQDEFYYISQKFAHPEKDTLNNLKYLHVEGINLNAG